MMRRFTLPLVALVLLAGLSGCASREAIENSRTPTPTPSVTYTPSVQEYEGPYCCTIIMPGSGLIF